MNAMRQVQSMLPLLTFLLVAYAVVLGPRRSFAKVADGGCGGEPEQSSADRRAGPAPTRRARR